MTVPIYRCCFTVADTVSKVNSVCSTREFVWLRRLDIYKSEHDHVGSYWLKLGDMDEK